MAIGVAVSQPFLGVSSLNFGPLLSGLFSGMRNGSNSSRLLASHVAGRRHSQSRIGSYAIGHGRKTRSGAAPGPQQQAGLGPVRGAGATDRVAALVLDLNLGLPDGVGHGLGALFGLLTDDHLFRDPGFL
jgi:hypothetical protein